MSLQIQAFPAVPEETARVARAAFPKGNVYMKMRDELGGWYEDDEFAPLFGVRGQPGISPAWLNTIMVMQYVEGLTDRQAADAVRARIDWKYLLGLELSDAGFDHSVLSEHRDRLIAGSAERQLLDQMLARFQARGLIKERGAQRTDSTHVLASIRNLNRLEMVGETMRQALNQLATAAPDWLRQQVAPDWFDTYSHRFEQYRLPKHKQERQVLAEAIGADGYHLLSAVYSASAPEGLRQNAAVEILRQVWLQQFYQEEGQVRWREKGNLPSAAVMIQSPYDPEARYSTKRSIEWTGYKAHLTETCDEETPHLITNVETTEATEPDGELTETIHNNLAKKELLPGEHLIDAGYVDAGILVTSRAKHNIDVVGPVQEDSSWQAKAAQGFDLSCFVIDWPTQTVTCPKGHSNRVWSASQDRYGNAVIHVRFDKQACGACAVRSKCTRSKDRPRALKFQPQAQQTALQAARQYQSTDEFKQRYARRAGIEGTVSQATSFGLRRSRYTGLAKTHLQNVLTVTAINLTRVVDWLEGKPRAPTRTSPFAVLASS